ncbi:MAG: hypothetical protein DMF56_13565 [Acidobacteria bacterium]|nr:MAG: hypothetical protein DMF56_13565 [Acidobacteriota bacterium]
MIATCFVYMLIFAGMAIALGTIGALGTYALHGDGATRDFVRTYFGTFNAIGVASTGYALMLFVRTTGRSVMAQLVDLLHVPDEHATQFARQLHRITSWGPSNWICIPLTIIGSVALWWRGFPLAGFSKVYLALSAFSIYYVASNILSFYLFVILLFRFIEEHSRRTGARFRLNVSPGGMEMRTIDTFLVTSATMGVFTLYVGIRATLTATFADTVPFLRELLLLPFILYLPATLCYSLYPRYVLRHISECDALASIEELERQVQSSPPGDIRSNLELRKLTIELKEKMLNDCRSTPVLGLKDAPSLTMSIVVILQFIAQKDNVYAEFFKSLFG